MSLSTLLNNRITDELFEMARRKRKNVLEQQQKKVNSIFK